MCHQLPIGGVKLRDVGQETLLRLPLNEVEELLKVVGEKDAVVIFKVLVQLFEYFAEGVTLLHILNGIILEEFPGHAAEASEDVQHRLTSSFADDHLLVVEVEAFPVLFVL